MPLEEHKPFQSYQGKLNFLLEDHAIRLRDGVPCCVGNDVVPECLNIATVANIYHDATVGAWIMTAMCEECTKKLAKVYGVDLGEKE